MKITFVCPPLNMTGGIRVVAIYAKYLRSFGHEVLVVSAPRTSSGRVSRLLKRLGLPELPARPQPPSHLDGQGIAQKVLRYGRRIRERHVPDADVIVATWWETAEFIAPMAPAKGRKVYFVQHHEVFEHMPLDRVKATYRSTLPKIVIAKWLIKAIEDDGNREGATLVPNAVDPRQFFAPVRGKRARPRIGTLFSETPFKGFDITLAVIALVRQSLPEVEVVAYGELAPSRYRRESADMDVIVGPSQDRLRDIYASCDVWLCCSKSEGFNLIAMEAMACRTPVVSTRTGWPEEAIVDGVNGWLADVDDVAALARGVLAVLDAEPAAWERMSAHAALTVADSSWEASARMFEAALNATKR
jgi:glycosyltransferase involved in cell wall biosynthesis